MEDLAIPEPVRHPYFQLVQMGDIPEFSEDEQMEHIVYPHKDVFNGNMARIKLLRDVNMEGEYKDLFESEKALALVDGKFSMTDRGNALSSELYELFVDIDSESSRYRNIEARVYLSLDGKSDSGYSLMFNTSDEDDEIHEKETNLATLLWKFPDREESFPLYVPNDTSLLNKLSFRVEITQPRQEVDNN